MVRQKTKKKLVEALYFGIFSVHAILGAILIILSVPIFWLLISHPKIVASVTEEMGVPFYYPFLGVSVKFVQAMGSFLVGTYVLVTKQWRTGISTKIWILVFVITVLPYIVGLFLVPYKFTFQ